MKVAELMTTEVLSVSEDATVLEIADLLLARGISAVPVTDRQGSLIGLVSEADLMLPVTGHHASGMVAYLLEVLEGDEQIWVERVRDLRARDVMVCPVHTVPPDESSGGAARRMATLGVKRLPVVGDDGRLVGILSRHDLLKVIEEHEDDILCQRIERLLERYFYFPPDYQVRVHVHEGRVELEGMVRFERDSRVIAALAGSQPGVMSLDNRLVVTSDAYPYAVGPSRT